MKEPKIGETYYAVPCDHRFCNGKYITVESIGSFYFQYIRELQNGIRLITKSDLEIKEL